ncbi:hybrid cluster protein-associated redox disulfide domain-containing protein [Desulfuromusa kysingii]|uniref:Hybrid cluster protein-associated redox disulfide domain-containing protein n=1 Tax=Desulfuromusa kysingii TaxID=37625 RepID=A0A1H4BKD9_9BACT|nr:DUF1858 domain-containing protein [Desulfuromusa kysingii]SEA48262.1 hybrid cluster protein-associated redox disulfide domain-containing protein [Desulfuromusa kysingii]
MAQKITKDMTFNQVLQMNPAVSKVFDKFNLDCGECLGASTESLAQGAKAHGLNIDEILVELNAIFKN